MEWFWIHSGLSYPSLAESCGQRLTSLLQGWPLCRSGSVLAWCAGAAVSAQGPQRSHSPWSSCTDSQGNNWLSTESHTGFPPSPRRPHWSPQRTARLQEEVEEVFSNHSNRRTGRGAYDCQDQKQAEKLLKVIRIRRILQVVSLMVPRCSISPAEKPEKSVDKNHLIKIMRQYTKECLKWCK